MKKTLLATLSIVFLAWAAYGQQPQNPGFENWEDAGTVIDEPVNWSSIKTSDGGDVINNFAPVVWAQSTDAHSGNYSIELINVQSLLLATGTLTNGRIHASLTPGASNSYTNPDDPRWNTPLTSRPDSLAVWIKYYPQGNDTAQIKAVLHVGDGTLPPTPENEGNWIGYAQINVWETVEEWTRVVVPFTYFSQANPEYILFVMTSGAGLQPVEGSIVRYDDLELVYDPSGLDDLNAEKSLLYSYGMTVCFDKFPVNELKGAEMELIGLDGSSIFSSAVTSPQMNLSGRGIKGGLYIVKIKGNTGFYAQKIQLR